MRVEDVDFDWALAPLKWSRADWLIMKGVPTTEDYIDEANCGGHIP